ncbi:MAG TPA: metalloregulator ArsR/SmtB family transcription factor [Acidimicrobiales bacterium]
MVVDLQERPMTGEDRADLVFNALADRTRRDILRRSMDGELSVSALARPYAMSLAAVQKHVAVLDRAGLVTKHRRGREQLVRTDMATVQAAQALLDEFEAVWRARIDRFTDVLNTPNEGAAP